MLHYTSVSTGHLNELNLMFNTCVKNYGPLTQLRRDSWLKTGVGRAPNSPGRASLSCRNAMLHRLYDCQREVDDR